MAMNTVFLHLSEEAIKRLNKLRGWRKVSRSAILREAVEQYLERQQFPVRKAKGGRQKGEVVGVDDRGNRRIRKKSYAKLTVFS
ncbi:TPA: CopG family transcriptional regulator [Escherichia coli]|nr:CopG family transcriptional regulator [Escherichia coli]HAP3174672.1 CopG family transcriptional regulator [Escherichia coli]HDQ2792910.1 CopG family transcriptional regulator [Escherichia coli]